MKPFFKTLLFFKAMGVGVISPNMDELHIGEFVVILSA